MIGVSRYRAKVRSEVHGHETYKMIDVPSDVPEFYVVDIQGDEAEIEVPESAQIEMLRNELENLKRRVVEIERAVMHRATA